MVYPAEALQQVFVWPPRFSARAEKVITYQLNSTKNGERKSAPHAEIHVLLLSCFPYGVQRPVLFV